MFIYNSACATLPLTGGSGTEVSRCQAVVDALAQQLEPHVSLDHIHGSHLADRDTLTINHLLDIFSGDPLIMPSYQILSSSCPSSSSPLFCSPHLLLSNLPPLQTHLPLSLVLLTSPISPPPAPSYPCFFSVLFHLPVTSAENSSQHDTPQIEEKDSNVSNFLFSRGHFTSLYSSSARFSFRALLPLSYLSLHSSFMLYMQVYVCL